MVLQEEDAEIFEEEGLGTVEEEDWDFVGGGDWVFDEEIEQEDWESIDEIVEEEELGTVEEEDWDFVGGEDWVFDVSIVVSWQCSDARGNTTSIQLRYNFQRHMYRIVYLQEKKNCYCIVPYFFEEKKIALVSYRISFVEKKLLLYRIV